MNKFKTVVSIIIGVVMALGMTNECYIYDWCGCASVPGMANVIFYPLLLVCIMFNIFMFESFVKKEN